MSLFLTPFEKQYVLCEYTHGKTARLYWTTLNRVMRRCESPGLVSREDTVEWWHMVEESVCDAAMMYALQPAAAPGGGPGGALGAWLRNVTMGIVRRPLADWVGPWFRDHSRNPPMAELETAHVTVAVAAAVDLAGDVFTSEELAEALACLRERAIPMAVEHLRGETQIHNHWCVVTAGLAVAAALVDDRTAMGEAADAYRLYCQTFQPDGTYAESLQYANYACFNLMLAYEALVRRDAAFAGQLNPGAYAGLATWSAYAHLYNKPLSKWGQEPQPRAINFGDSAAVFVPSAELLLHISARARESHPEQAKIARWLFDTAINHAPAVAPHDRASFGFVNRPGFLTMPLMANAAAAASPGELGLPVLRAFGCGDVIARDAWDGLTTLAVRTGGDAMHVVSHVHGDMNSLILVHNRERLLVDPGHSCYRSFIHELECSTVTHNTCTFEVPGQPRELVQGGIANRKRLGDGLAPPIASLTRRALVAADGPVQVIGADAAGRYGAPIEQFLRFTIMCGAHAVFVVDQIRSAVPVRARWNWLLNNRDGRGELKVIRPDRVVFRRGDAALKIFNTSGAHVGGPQYAFVHDAYHTLPGQLGEGASGSGLLVHWRETNTATTRTVVHAMAVDNGGSIASWHLIKGDGTVGLGGHDGRQKWTLRVGDGAEEGLGGMELSAELAGSGGSGTVRSSWRVVPGEGGVWSLVGGR